jgi:hypothetical protein
VGQMPLKLWNFLSTHCIGARLIFSFEDVPDFLKSGNVRYQANHRTPPRPHIKLECVGLCGIGIVGGLTDPLSVPNLEKKGYSTR